jgi:hypothetical protein
MHPGIFVSKLHLCGVFFGASSRARGAGTTPCRTFFGEFAEKGGLGDSFSAFRPKTDYLGPSMSSVGTKIITTKALKMISRIFGVFSILSSASSSYFDLTQGLANVNNDPRDTWIRSQRSFYPRV